MKYEQEIIELIPMLKNYLKKIIKKYNVLHDFDEVFQECLLNIIQGSQNREIQEAKKYFIGIAKNTVNMIVNRINRDRILIEKYGCHKSGISKDSYYNDILNDMELQLKKKSISLNKVWTALKVFNGDIGRVAEHLECSKFNVSYHKQELKKIYKDTLIKI